MPKCIQVRNFYDITNEEWRVITAIETGMRNHEYVDLNLIHQNASINYNGNSFIKILRNSLIPRRVIAYQNNGYRLTNLGYDFLALHKFVMSQIISDLTIFRIIATGKESDIYICRAGNSSVDNSNLKYQAPIILKFHRLGRTSFKQVLNKREYKKGSKCSWLYMNRLSSKREYITMKALYQENIPVPAPLAQNRSAVAMEFIKNSYPLSQFSKGVLKNGAAEVLFQQATRILIDLAKLGLVHGDLNEFNLMVETNGNCDDDAIIKNYLDDLPEQSDEENVESDEDNEESYEDNVESDEDNVESDEDNVESDEDNVESDADNKDEESEVSNDDTVSDDDCNTYCPYMNDDVNSFKLRVIDFPQVISRNNQTAQEIYSRDRQGLIDFFKKFMKIDEGDLPPQNISDIERQKYIDVDLKAPGYPTKMDLRDLNIEYNVRRGNATGDTTSANNVRRNLTQDDIKRRYEKEQLKKAKNNRISKQQRSTKKTQLRSDIQHDW